VQTFPNSSLLPRPLSRRLLVSAFPGLPAIGPAPPPYEQGCIEENPLPLDSPPPFLLSERFSVQPFLPFVLSKGVGFGHHVYFEPYPYQVSDKARLPLRPCSVFADHFFSDCFLPFIPWPFPKIPAKVVLPHQLAPRDGL